jgi:ribosome recycling factor
MTKDILQDAEKRMEKTLSTAQLEMNKVRTGRANLSLLDTVRVNYFGAMVPLKQVANIGIPEPRLIIIQPWDRNLLSEIEKAILKADIGINPASDGHIIRLPIPSLTEERRKDLVRLVHQMAEEGKVAIRNVRRDAIEHLRKAEKDHGISQDDQHNAENEIQKMTDKFIKIVDDSMRTKEKEVMEV